MSVQPVEAATVILVREAPVVGSPWECFMLRRPVQSEFAADVYVFPGGKVDEADRAPEMRRRMVDHTGPEVAQLDWYAFKAAAIRELFEEAGVLLARDSAGELIHFNAGDTERFDHYRHQLLGGELTLLELAERENLEYVGDRLHPFSRWITPEALPRRYDTVFFVAQLPKHQEALANRVESTDGLWIAPEEALRRHQEDSFPLVFPTRKHLERMAAFHSIDQMIAATRASDLTPVIPRMIERAGEHIFLLPGDDGY